MWVQLAWVLFAFSSLAAATLLGVMYVQGARDVRSAEPGPSPFPGVPSAEALASMAGDLGAVRAEWAAWRKQVEAYLDSFDDLAELVERRRRRSAAAEARMKREKPEDQADEPDPLAERRELRMRARAMGIEGL